MSSTDQTAAVDDLNTSEVLARLEELRTSRRRRWARTSLYVVSVCYGVIAWLDGSAVFRVYLGLLVVIFSALALHDAQMRVIQAEIDLIVKLLSDQQEKKDDQARVA